MSPSSPSSISFLAKLQALPSLPQGDRDMKALQKFEFVDSEGKAASDLTVEKVAAIETLKGLGSKGFSREAGLLGNYNRTLIKAKDAHVLTCGHMRTAHNYWIAGETS